MRGLFFKQILRRKFASLLFIISITLIFITLPIIATSLTNVNQEVESNITHYARGSYDLLIRANEVKHPLEEELGIVPENYIGLGNGGISYDQWQKIKNREDIEIAAPIASLGYFTGEQNNFALYEPVSDYERHLVQFQTTDGINRYPLGSEYTCYQIKLSENDISSGTDGYFYNNYDFVINPWEELLNYCQPGASAFPIPPMYYLTVGIDPEEEEKLTGISYDSINPKYFLNGQGYTESREIEGAQTIPLLEVAEEDSSIFVEIKVDQLPLNKELVTSYREGIEEDGAFFSLLNDTDKYNVLLEQLNGMKEVHQKQFHLDISSLIQAYDQNPEGILLYEDGHLGSIEEYMIKNQEHNYFISFSKEYTTVSYKAGNTNYELVDGQYTIKKMGEDNGVPIYREVVKEGLGFREALQSNSDISIRYITQLVNRVEIGDKKESLASSPLAIYQNAPVMFIGEGSNEPVPMQATLSPGGFVTPSASGLTNIQSAEFIKGDKPIDAIRVKVAGLSTYTKDAANKIENIANEIREMGLDVQIIAGSSPQKLKVNVEGVGLVEETWTTLGAAGNIISEWNLTTAIIGILFFVVTLLYLLNRMKFWQVDSNEDHTLLLQIGWKTKHVMKLSSKEMISLVLVAFIFSLPILWSIKIWLDFSNSVLFWLIGFGFVISVYVYIFIYFAVTRLSEAGRRTRQIKIKRQYKTLVGKNLSFYRNYIRSPFLQLTIVSTLSSFVYLAIAATNNQTSITLLGDYISLQTSQFTTIITIVAYMLAVVTLIESLLSLLKVREQEIRNFRMIGWRNIHIFSLYYRETLIWAGTAIALGSVMSSFIFSILYPLQWNSMVVIAISFIGFFSLVLLVAGLVIQIQLTKRFVGTVRFKKNKVS